MISLLLSFFFKNPAPTEIYTLSLHDALPISSLRRAKSENRKNPAASPANANADHGNSGKSHGCGRSEEHTSELQSLRHLVCRLLLEKKKKQKLTKLNSINLLPCNNKPNKISI